MKICNVYIPVEIACALISGVISIGVAIISFYTNKHKTKSELAKFKMEMEHADKLRAEDAAIAHDREIAEKYTEMLNAIAVFSEAPDVNTKNAAISAINRLTAVGNAECAETLRAVKKEIERTDAFERPQRQCERSDDPGQRVRSIGGLFSIFEIEIIQQYLRQHIKQNDDFKNYGDHDIPPPTFLSRPLSGTKQGWPESRQRIMALKS